MDSGVFEYIKWRGDLSFKVSAFNEIDALIFCELSYLHLKGIVPSDLELSENNRARSSRLRVVEKIKD